MKGALCITIALGSFTLGIVVGHRLGPKERNTVSNVRRPAYLVANWDILHPGQLKPFGDAVMPLAKRAGMSMLVASQPEVLEGEWPTSGVLFVEKYDSMQALLKFWRSPENRAAQKLREGHVDSHFVIAADSFIDQAVSPAAAERK